jgi:AcrR family transcriptional regulator
MLTVIVKKKERTDSRASMVRGAVSLIRTRGVNATSFSDVLAKSGAPRGSIYYHFPKGKEQLAGDAIRWTSDGGNHSHPGLLSKSAAAIRRGDSTSGSLGAGPTDTRSLATFWFGQEP